jgi:hypothetical protein
LPENLKLIFGLQRFNLLQSRRANAEFLEPIFDGFKLEVVDGLLIGAKHSAKIHNVSNVLLL